MCCTVESNTCLVHETSFSGLLWRRFDEPCTPLRVTRTKVLTLFCQCEHIWPMDSLAELTINQQKGLMSMYASQTDSHHSNVRWPKCALLKKKKRCSYEDRQHRQNAFSCQQAFMWIALRIQTGSKSNNCPFYTAVQYIKVWLQRHLGSPWVQNTRWWTRRDEWTKL